MADTFEDIRKRYEAYRNRALKQDTISQTLSSGLQYMANDSMINRLDVTRPQGMSTGKVSLNSFNVVPEATKALDRSFNTMLNFTREGGQKVDPTLLSKYTEGVTSIGQTQAKINTETKNQEKLTNFQASERAKEFNTQIGIQYARDVDANKAMKAQGNMNNLGALSVGLANISNMRNKALADNFSAEAESMMLDKQIGWMERQYPPVKRDNTKPTPESIVKATGFPSLWSGKKAFDISKVSEIPSLTPPVLPEGPTKSFAPPAYTPDRTFPEIKTGQSLFSNSAKSNIPTLSKEGFNSDILKRTSYSKNGLNGEFAGDKIFSRPWFEDINLSPLTPQTIADRTIEAKPVENPSKETYKVKDSLGQESSVKPNPSTPPDNTIETSNEGETNFDETIAEFIKTNENKNYTLGSKAESDSIDCSGLVCDYIDQTGDSNAYAKDKSSQGLWVQSDDKKIYQTREEFLAEAESIPNNTVIAFSTGGTLGKNRMYGIDHVGVVVIDKSGKKYIMESSSSKKGFAITPLEERIAEIPLDNVKGKGVIFTGKIKS